MRNLHIGTKFIIYYKKEIIICNYVSLEVVLLSHHMSPANIHEHDCSKRKPCHRQTPYLPPAVTALPQEVFVLGPNSVSCLERTTATQGMLLHFRSKPTHTADRDGSTFARS